MGRALLLICLLSFSIWASSDFGNFEGCSYEIDIDNDNGSIKWFCQPGTKIEFVPVINGKMLPNLNGNDRYIIIKDQDSRRNYSKERR